MVDRRLVDSLKRNFGALESIPVEGGQKLIKLLEEAPTEALQIIVREKVKFCWTIAGRILRERGVK